MATFEWTEALHPRAPKGSATGGRFVSKGGAAKAVGAGRRGVSAAQQRGAWVLDAADREEMKKYREFNRRDPMSDNVTANQMSDTERSSVENYVGKTSTFDINKLLRTGTPLNEWQRSVVFGLDSLMKKIRLNQYSILYRYVDLSDDNFAKQFNSLQPGSLITDPAFVSTTYDRTQREVTRGFAGTMKILAPSGSQALVVPSTKDFEQEVILARNSTLEYVGHDPDDGSEVFRLVR